MIIYDEVVSLVRLAFTKRYAGGIVTEIVHGLYPYNATLLLMELSSTDSISPEVGKESPAEKNSTNSGGRFRHCSILEWCILSVLSQSFVSFLE